MVLYNFYLLQEKQKIVQRLVPKTQQTKQKGFHDSSFLQFTRQKPNSIYVPHTYKKPQIPFIYEKVG